MGRGESPFLTDQVESALMLDIWKGLVQLLYKYIHPTRSGDHDGYQVDIYFTKMIALPVIICLFGSLYCIKNILTWIVKKNFWLASKFLSFYLIPVY